MDVVAGAVDELELDQLLLAVETDPPLAREVDRGVAGLALVAEEHVAPAAAGRQVAHVDHAMREVVEEDARLERRLDALFHDVGDDLRNVWLASGSATMIS